jgi:hypothetical protein
LTSRAAELVETTTTSSDYRLFALATVPAKPGVVRVAEGGSELTVEIWRMGEAAFGSFVASLPRPMAIGTVTLLDGSEVSGFVVEPVALATATDITAFGGWRQYLSSL